MDPLFDIDFLDRLYDEHLDAAEDRSTRALMLCERARRLESEEEGMAVEAYEAWRAAANEAPQLQTARMALLRYAGSDLLNIDARGELIEFMDKICSVAERVELALLQARRAEERDEPRSAAAALEKVLEFDEDNRTALSRLEALARARGQYPQATDWLMQRAEVTSDARLKATLALDAGLTEEMVVRDRRSAIEHLQQGTEAAPNDRAILGALIRNTKSISDWGAAVHWLEREAKATSVDEERLVCLYEAARLSWRQLGNSDAARRALRPLIATATYLPVLRLYREIGLESGADDLTLSCERLVAAAVTPSEKTRWLWLLSEELGDGVEATEALTAAIEADPNYVTVSVALELASYQPDAAASLVDALERRGRAEQIPGLIVHAGRIALEQLEDDRRAEQLFREALQEVATTDALFGPFGAAEALLELLRTNNRRGEEVELTSWLLEQSIESPQRQVLQNRLADLLSRASDVDAALEGWRMVLSLDPHESYAYARMGALLARQGRWEELFHLRETERDLTEVVDRERSEVLRWECAEILARRLGRIDEALGYLDQGLERAPRFLPYLVSSARLLIEHKRDRALATLYRRELERVATAEEASRLSLNLAMLYEHQIGDVEAATRYYAKVLEYHSNNLPALEALVRLGDLAGERSRATDALGRLAAHEADPTFSAAMYYQHGRRLETLHDNLEDASVSYARAVSKAPELTAASIAWERCTIQLGRLDALEEHLEYTAGHAVDALDAIESLERLILVVGPEREGRVIESLLTQKPDHLGALMRLFRRASTRNSPSALTEVFRALAAAVPPGTAQAAFSHASVMFDMVSRGAQQEHELWPIVEMRPRDTSPLVRLLSGLFDNDDSRTQVRVYGAFARGAFTSQEQASYLTALGRLLADDGQNERASMALEEALRVLPEYLPAIKLVRILAEDVGANAKFAEAVEAEAKAMDNPEQTIKHLLRAADIRQRQMGDISGAAAALEEILELNPEHDNAYQQLRHLYTSQSKFDDLYRMLLRRAELLQHPELKRKTLLHAAELAYERLRDMDRAIRAHREILAFDPGFLRSYRVIAEIYLEREDWRNAADALLGVIKRARDEKLLGRTWFQLAEVYDKQIDDIEKAIAAYLRALEYLPEHTDALSRLAAVYERVGDFKQTVRTLQQLAQIERIPLKRKEVLMKLCDMLVSHFKDFDAAEEVLVTAREIDPSDIAVTHHLAEIYRKSRMMERRRTFLRNSFSEYRDRFHADVSRPSPLKAMFDIARSLDHKDMGFTVASLLSFVGAATDEQKDLYRSVLERTGRVLPKKPLPMEKTGGIFAPGLHLNVLHMMRATEPFLRRFAPHSLKTFNATRKHRVSVSTRQQLKTFVPLASVFGIELPDIYIVPDRGDALRLVLGDEPAIVMDERDLEPVLLPETMMRVAVSCAALSMGLGTFALVDKEHFAALILGITQAVLPERQIGAASQRDAIDTVARVIPRKTADTLAGYVLEIVGRLNAEFVEQQHQAVIATSMRLGLLTMHDPRPGLTVVARDGDAGRFDVVDIMKDALLFLVSDRYWLLRKECGVAVDGASQ